GRGRQAPQKPGARADVQSKRRAQGIVTYRHLGVHGRKACSRSERLLEGLSLGWPVRLQAHPLPALSVGNASADRKTPGVWAYSGRHGPASGPGCSGLAFGMFVRQAGAVCLRCWMVSEAQHGRFSKGPLEMGIADFSA